MGIIGWGKIGDGVAHLAEAFGMDCEVHGGGAGNLTVCAVQKNGCWYERELLHPFLDYDTEIRKVICSTNAIESLNARYRRAVRARGHFPAEQAALKCLYLVTRSLDPTGAGRARWTMRWKPVLNAFAITFGDRWPAAETY